VHFRSGGGGGGGGGGLVGKLVGKSSITGSLDYYYYLLAQLAT
jgi:hypothetical protein